MIQKVNFTNCASLKKSGHTSKGDQQKWLVDNVWYKADYMGYEGLSEVVVSHLLQKSSIKYPFVVYDYVKIQNDDCLLNGCCSRNFLTDEWTLVPIEKLYRQYTGDSLAMKLVEFDDVRDRIEFLANWVAFTTKMIGFGEYLTAILEIDAFFMNEDRHTNNLAVLYNKKDDVYALCPIFDQGLALFSDTTIDYQLEKSIDDCIKKISAKPFSLDFDTQLDAAEELYGVQLAFSFTKSDAKAIIEDATSEYPAQVKDRVENLIYRQMRKYQYLMIK